MFGVKILIPFPSFTSSLSTLTGGLGGISIRPPSSSDKLTDSFGAASANSSFLY